MLGSVEADKLVLFADPQAHDDVEDLEDGEGHHEGVAHRGDDANQLVDELGGLQEAFELARTRAKIDPDADIVVEVYPRPRKTLVQRWLGGVLEEPDNEEARLPGLAAFGHWYEMATMPAGRVQALMPYTIEIR